MVPSKTNAIQTALAGDWDNAISLNLELLKEDPNDIDSLNRLAFAYGIIGKTKDAKDTYKKVLEIDQQNPIALKNLKKLATSSPEPANGNGHAPYRPMIDIGSMFIEETGKTKVIELINIAEPKTIMSLRVGETLLLSIKRLKIYMLDEKKQFIGMLPDDIAKRLIEFMKGGNEYIAYVKTVENRKIFIFLKETKRAPKFKNQPSFTPYNKVKGTFDSSHKDYDKSDGDDDSEE